MFECKLNWRDVTRSILLATFISILIGSLGCTEAAAYYSLIKEPRTTVTPPPVILQTGTAGTSTVYTNNTSAKVDDIPAGTGQQTSTYYPSSNTTTTGTYVSGNLTSLQVVDADYFVTNSTPSTWTTVTIRPDADGTFTAWTGTYTDVNETEEDGDTTYVSANATGLSESYQLQNHTTETEMISNVKVIIYARQTSGNEQIYITLVINGTEHLGALITPKTQPVYKEYTSDWATNPATNTTWTWSDIDTLEAGIRSLANAAWEGEERVTQLYVEVTYEKPSEYKVDTTFEFSGLPTQSPTKLNFTVISEYDTADVLVTVGIRDYALGAWNNTYEYTSTGAANETHSVIIITDAPNYTSSGSAQIHIEGTKTTSTLFQQKLNQIKLEYTYVSSQTYDYVLRVNNTVTDTWQIRLKKYADSNISRLQNCTIYFRNSTNANSTQIVIENGSFNQTEGPWYALGSLEAIYIATTVEANSTGTSYIYTYMEIRIPNTTTYAQYIITFRVT